MKIFRISYFVFDYCFDEELRIKCGHDDCLYSFEQIHREDAEHAVDVKKWHHTNCRGCVMQDKSYVTF